MMMVIFRSRLRPEVAQEYAVWAKEMATLAKQQPGYISDKTFIAADGERVTLAVFESEEAVISWRQHPRHQMAQRLGQERFYSEYSVQVCDIVRDYSFVREESHA